MKHYVLEESENTTYLVVLWDATKEVYLEIYSLSKNKIKAPNRWSQINELEKKNKRKNIDKSQNHSNKTQKTLKKINETECCIF